ncbi:protein TIC 21, chloroplastic [Dendrobium catenatum]|uniref:Protein TIC 21, chloroplastic n=1 Tax=Dendrobium catenatum TaxID=906689 RepID=A0A2I0XFH6_9ASPA|nr:protein TIC 21, chloroplastic [Dendrobium catenatum]PKU86668.1 Protein TIC 21, chloroplastic [Dendrobium catenatum]
MQMLLIPSPSPSRVAAAFYAAPPLSHPHWVAHFLSSTTSLSSHPNSRQIHPYPSLLPRSRRLVQSLSDTTSMTSHSQRQRIHLCPSLVSLSHLFSPLSVRAAPASAPTSGYPTADEQSEMAKLAQVSKRLENTSRYFKRLGSFGFWGQLVCTVVSAVIISFSSIVTGKVTSPVTFYATAGGIAAAFVSVFWSFGYIRLSERLRKTANDPTKAPPRADVVKSLRNGIFVNILGMGASILGMQATVGLLVAKALTSSAVPYYQGIPPGQSPVLALDVFLVQASANTILSHFLGLVSSLELLRSVTLPNLQGLPIHS